MKRRPEDHILTTPDPEEFRCPNCNPKGWNRTGQQLPENNAIIGKYMWGVACLQCIEGWREYETVELY